MPNDFSGQAKTADTYDKDWVFNKQQGAWVTKVQNKKYHNQELKQRQARRAASAAAPATGGTTSTVTPPAPSVVPVPGPSGIMTTGNGTESGAPPWWIGNVYQNPDANQAFANAANAILPTLSPEDQRTLAGYLATNYKDVYGGYANAQFAPIPTQLTTERRDYLNPLRAAKALDLLDRTQQAAGGTPGAGYDFLKNALGLLGKYSNTGPMTREQYNQFQNAVKQLTSSAGSDMSAYSNLAQLFNLPSFTAGPIVSNAPIPGLFT